MKLDYSITSPAERNELVKKILEETPEPTEQYLEILSDYLINCMEKEERKQRKILTENRMLTVNKRETSFEGLASSLENGEDGIYGLIVQDKNQIFQPKVTITKEDIENIPPLKQLRETINLWEEKLKTTEGRINYVIRKALIEMRKDQYVIKNCYLKPVLINKFIRTQHPLNLEDKTHQFNDLGFPIPEGATLLNYKICSAILCNYSKLKEDSFEDLAGDIHFLLMDFDEIADAALKDYPLYDKLVELKIDGLSNQQIQEELQKEFGIKHSLEYISSLWRNKIPKLIADEAEARFINYYYRENGIATYKRCSCCGQYKLAHNKFFSKNNTSKDGFYSLCKECRRRKNKKGGK